MPFESSLFSLPCGARCVRMEVAGTLSPEETAALLKLVEPSGELFGLPMVVLAQRLRSLPAESRALIAKRGEVGPREPWTAAVVTNPVIRVTANFIIRVQKSKKLYLFSSEAEASEWLDARVREDAALKT